MAADGYGKVQVVFGGSRNVSQADKDGASLRVFFNGVPVEKKNGAYEKLMPVGTRLTVTAEAVSADGRIVGKGEETFIVKSGKNNVPVKIYTYDNFVVTIDGKATGYTEFWDAWLATNGETATLKMNADVVISNSSPGVDGGNVTLDLNGHTLTGEGSSSALQVDGGTLNLIGKGTVKQPANASVPVIHLIDGTFNMYDGTITGGGGSTGGGVNLETGTIFNMYGGTISGNTATQGGGVYVSVGATFNQNSGSVTGNSPDNVFRAN